MQPPITPGIPVTKPVELDNGLPFDENGPDSGWLDTLQGNILKAHGRPFAVHLCFTLPPDRTRARQLVTDLAGLVTTARVQFTEAARFRKFRISGKLFGTLALSGSGYARLDERHPALSTYSYRDENDAQKKRASLFARGMRAAGRELSDPPAEALEAPYQGTHAIDAMLILAHDDRHALLEAARDVIDTVEHARGVMVAVEHGNVRRNAAKEGVEHFDFVDGRSQPQFLLSDFTSDLTADDRKESIDQWNPFEPLRRVLVRDPGVTDVNCFGSFLVFRKLEQNVKGFREELARIAAALGRPGDEGLAHAGALVVGRYQDGTPLALQGGPDGHPTQSNNFTYATDIRGGRCPLHAHIRKVNPRGHSRRTGDGPEDERRRRITRRSMVYGERAEHETPETLPTSGVGVLFMCYQASIEDQFAFMQQEWCNTASFPQSYVGVDPLAGQDDPRELAMGAQPGGTNESHQHFWPEGYNRDPTTKAPFQTSVKLLGGEFFFVPSLPFLRSLAGSGSVETAIADRL